MYSALFCALLVITTINHVQGYVQFVCPKRTSLLPSTEDAHIQAFESDISQNNSTGWTKLLEIDARRKTTTHSKIKLSETEFSTIQPGLMTVKFQANDSCQDSYFRIQLAQAAPTSGNFSENSDNTTDIEKIESCVLLDHIPFNSGATASQDCHTHGNTRDNCNSSAYRVTIRIPDVKCNFCYLVLEQIFNSDETHCFTGRPNATGVSQVSYSVSRVRILASEKGSETNLSSCTNYLLNVPPFWPHRPFREYQTAYGDVLVYDILHRQLIVNIFRAKNNLRQPLEKVEMRVNSTIVWEHTVDKSSKQPSTFTWSEMDNTAVQSLQANGLVLNVISTKESFASQILFSRNTFGASGDESSQMQYSRSGWLVPNHDDHITGLPCGPCLTDNDARHFMAFLRSVHVTAHGIVGISVVDDIAHITAILHVNFEQVKKIRFIGPLLTGAETLEVEVNNSMSGVFQASVSVKQQVKYLYDEPNSKGSVPHLFWRSVEIDTDKEDSVLVGGLEETMFSILRDSDDNVHGMGGIHFTNGHWMRVEVMFQLLDNYTDNKSVTLEGPDGTLVDLSRSWTHCNSRFCCVETYVFEVTSDTVLHLGLGQARFRVNDDHTQFIGQITKRNTKMCKQKHSMCIDSQDAATNTRVHVAVTVDRVDTIYVSVQAQNVQWRDDKHVLFLSQRVEFRPLHNYFQTELAHTEMHSSNKSFILSLLDGLGVVTVVELPFATPGCIHSKEFVVGEGSNYWSDSSAPFNDVTALVGDGLKFVFDNSTSLYRLTSRAAYDACNFSEAVELPDPEHTSERPRSYFISLTEPNTFYFFADIHRCNATPPVKIIARTVNTSGHMIQNSSLDTWCRQSVSQAWQKNHEDSYHFPSMLKYLLIGLINIPVCLVCIALHGRELRAARKSSNEVGDRTCQSTRPINDSTNPQYNTDTIFKPFRFRRLLD